LQIKKQKQIRPARKLWIPIAVVGFVSGPV